MHYFGGDVDGQTPLDEDEAAQILRPAITTRAELDTVEQENIALAVQWAFGRKRSSDAVLDESFLRRLHKRMFGDVWRWAGTYRQTARNIGVDAWMIPQEVAVLIGDARYWVERNTYESTESSVRFHHRLVAIHPFPNGNGRHSRLAADLLIASIDGEPLTWGSRLELDGEAIRARYIAALRLADAGDVADLMAFARS